MKKYIATYLLITISLYSNVLKAQLTLINTGFNTGNYSQLVKAGNNILINNSKYQIIKSADYCNTFSNIYSYNNYFNVLDKLVAVDSNHLFLMYLRDTGASIITKSINGGQTWSNPSLQNIGITIDHVMFDTLNGISSRIVGDTLLSSLFKTTDGAVTWDTLQTVSKLIYPRLYRYGDSGICVLAQNKIFISNNRGNTWITNTFTDHYISDIITINKDTIFSISIYNLNMPYFLKSFNGGLTWQYLPITNYGNYKLPVKIHFRNLNEIYVFSNDYNSTSGFLKTTDLGLTWKLFSPNINLSVNDVMFVNDNNAFLACNFNKLFLWRTDQTTFVSLDKINKLSFSVNLFPNPAQDQQTFRLTTKIIAPLQIYLSNISGSRLKQMYNGVTESGENKVDLNIKNLPIGIYFYEVKFGESTERIRFVKYE